MIHNIDKDIFKCDGHVLIVKAKIKDFSEKQVSRDLTVTKNKQMTKQCTSTYSRGLKTALYRFMYHL